jgi:hypothetical protein
MRKYFLYFALLFLCLAANGEETNSLPWNNLAERLEQTINEGLHEETKALFYQEGLHEDFQKLLDMTLKRLSSSKNFSAQAEILDGEEIEEIKDSPFGTLLEPIGIVRVRIEGEPSTVKEGFYVGTYDGKLYLQTLVPKAFLK